MISGGHGEIAKFDSLLLREVSFALFPLSNQTCKGWMDEYILPDLWIRSLVIGMYFTLFHGMDRRLR